MRVNVFDSTLRSTAAAGLPAESDDPLLRFEMIAVGGVAVLAPIGEIDLMTAPLFAEHVAQLAEHATRLVIDLRAVSFMDSTGLEVLLDAYHRLGRNPEAMILSSPPPAVLTLLRITGLDGVLTVETDDGTAGGGASRSLLSAGSGW